MCVKETVVRMLARVRNRKHIETAEYLFYYKQIERWQATQTTSMRQCVVICVIEISHETRQRDRIYLIFSASVIFIDLSWRSRNTKIVGRRRQRFGGIRGYVRIMYVSAKHDTLPCGFRDRTVTETASGGKKIHTHAATSECAREKHFYR